MAVDYEHEYRKLMVCPECGCEAWLVEAEKFICLVCRFSSETKSLLLYRNIHALNQKLKYISEKDIGGNT